MRIISAVLLLLISVFAYAGADYVREKKWADEITPGIVVCDPIYLELKNGHKFLNLFTEVKDAKKALLSMKGLLIGFGWAFVIRFIMGMFMIGFWLIWAFV